MYPDLDTQTLEAHFEFVFALLAFQQLKQREFIVPLFEQQELLLYLSSKNLLFLFLGVKLRFSIRRVVYSDE